MRIYARGEIQGAKGMGMKCGGEVGLEERHAVHRGERVAGA